MNAVLKPESRCPLVIIGIDPGVTTGVARWSVAAQTLTGVTSMMIHRAMGFVADTQLQSELLVIFEDARLRTWFGAKGREALQGAGSIKRDCTAWEDFLQDAKIPYIAQPPKSGKTKLDKGRFMAITGWTQSTNEHSRDAAMICYAIDPRRAQVLMESARRKS